MDLSKIALPTFVLEPRSLLERITDFFSHPELIFGYVEIPYIATIIMILSMFPMNVTLAFLWCMIEETPI